MNLRPLLLFAAASPFWCAIPGENCKVLRHRGQMNEARACFSQLARSNDSFAQAEGLWGLDRFDDANNAFRAAEKDAPRSAQVKAEWGTLFLEHYQPGDAAKLYEEAIALDENYAPGYLGLAKAGAQGFNPKAASAAEEALKHDPKLYQAHEVLAYLALEDGNPKKAADEAQQALAISNEALDAMAVLASIDWLDGQAASDWMAKILKINPVYGEAYATGGHFFEINRRYNEAIQYYRKALALNGTLWAARSELGVNLARQGKDAEARQELERCYNGHFRNAQTVNSLRLLDSLVNFETFKTPTTELRVHKKEAALLRVYVEPEMQRAIAAYEKKYQMKLPGPVHLEMYPDHEDFIVRTLGLPGQGGLLGVTFGLTVTMDSPSARHPGEFNWASTMWHELSHVFILTATQHLVPRWFTEGLAVHEEGAASPDWGDRLTPEILSALEKNSLLPVTDLDQGFVHPNYPMQVMVSYFEAGKMCDFIAQKWGEAALLDMVHSYAGRQTTEQAIAANLHESPAQFDKEFKGWLNSKIEKVQKNFGDWKKGMKTMNDDLRANKLDEVIREGQAVRDDYPDYTGDGSAYEDLADAYQRKGNHAAALAELEKYSAAGGASVAVLKKLAEWEQLGGHAQKARNVLAKLNYIYPEDEEIHRRLGGLLLEAGDAEGAVREGKALVALKPIDAAESHFELAKALTAARRLSEAKDEVLLSLEAAPGYKPAQQLLLQLSQ